MKNALVYATLTFFALSCGAAAQSKKFHSGSSEASKSSGAYHAPKTADDEKKMPRSTAPPSTNNKSGVAQRTELNRLEHQSSQHLQAQSKHKAAPQSGHVQPVHSKSEGHGSDIKFAYRGPRGNGPKTTSGNGHKRQR